MPCLRSTCEPSDGTPVLLGLGTTTDNVDFELELGGTIAGTVVSSATGAPAQNVEVTIWNSAGDEAGSTYTDASGHYSVTGLYAGNHYASTRGELHRDELYDGIPCVESGCSGLDPTTGTPIVVGYDATLAGIDFRLEKLGGVTGHVVESLTGAPIYSTEVAILRADGSRAGYGYTDGTGYYQAGGLAAGTYFARTDGFSRYLDELYDDVPCVPDCDLALGTPITVELDCTVESIDFELDRLGSIVGQITHRISGDPIDDSYVRAESAGNGNSAYSNSFGNYIIERLIPGQYAVTAEHEHYLDELYDDVPFEDGCDPADATLIPVQVNSPSSGVDFELERLGRIAGAVTDTLTGDPVTDSHVEIFDANGSFVRSTGADFDGSYLVQGISPGVHYAVVRSSTFVDEIYDEAPCTETSCDPTAGTPITVELSSTAQGIDFALAPQTSCAPSATRLCLAEGRFSVEVSWEDFEGTTGQGFGQSLTGGSGYFWFFTPDNIELVVKVLDACYPPFDRFWIFGGGLTNVEVTLRVTDTVSGQVETYLNPLGTPFRPVQDTDSFTTCDD